VDKEVVNPPEPTLGRFFEDGVRREHHHPTATARPPHEQNTACLTKVNALLQQQFHVPRITPMGITT
jgi:hypothetical protein